MDPSLRLLIDLHRGLSRLGPGGPESTRRALALCQEQRPCLDILDIGCGAGAQTLTLAAATKAQITAVDRVPDFLHTLRATITEQGLQDRVRVIEADMRDLPFADASFDLVWSEGAIYIMGFDAGLASWRRLLRARGMLAVTELSWQTDNPPAEVHDYWQAEYPGLRTIRDNLAAAIRLGYEVLAHFTIPSEAWTHNYYRPLQARLAPFLAAHIGDTDAEALAESTRREIALYEKFSDTYGYTFYILRRSD